jgi:hypothetical protein
MVYTKTKIKKEDKILIILIIITILSVFIISGIDNAINSQLSNNLTVIILFSLFGLFMYDLIIRTTNIAELFIAFFLNTLTSVFILSILNNSFYKLLAFILFVIIIIPLALGFIFKNLTAEAIMRIIILSIAFSILFFTSVHFVVFPLP